MSDNFIRHSNNNHSKASEDNYCSTDDVKGVGGTGSGAPDALPHSDGSREALGIDTEALKKSENIPKPAEMKDENHHIIASTNTQENYNPINSHFSEKALLRKAGGTDSGAPDASCPSNVPKAVVGPNPIEIKDKNFYIIALTDTQEDYKSIAPPFPEKVLFINRTHSKIKDINLIIRRSYLKDLNKVIYDCGSVLICNFSTCAEKYSSKSPVNISIDFENSEHFLKRNGQKIFLITIVFLIFAFYLYKNKDKDKSNPPKQNSSIQLVQPKPPSIDTSPWNIQHSGARQFFTNALLSLKNGYQAKKVFPADIYPLTKIQRFVSEMRYHVNGKIDHEERALWYIFDLRKSSPSIESEPCDFLKRQLPEELYAPAKRAFVCLVPHDEKSLPLIRKEMRAWDPEFHDSQDHLMIKVEVEGVCEDLAQEIDPNWCSYGLRNGLYSLCRDQICKSP